MSVNSKILTLLAITTFCLGHTYAQENTLHFPTPGTTGAANELQAVASVDVCLDPGYCINIKDTNDIEVYQSTFNGGNPFTTYFGCGQMDVFTTFSAIIRATADATSPAAGDWSATLDGKTDLPLSIGTTSIAICVLGTEVQAHLLVSTEAQENVPVAQVTLQVIPQ